MAQQVANQKPVNTKQPVSTGGIDAGPSTPPTSSVAKPPMGGMSANLGGRPQLSRTNPFLNYGSVQGGMVVPNANPSAMPPGFMELTNPQNWGNTPGPSQIPSQGPIQTGPSQMPPMMNQSPYMNGGGFTGNSMPPPPTMSTPDYTNPATAQIPMNTNRNMFGSGRRGMFG